MPKYKGLQVDSVSFWGAHEGNNGGMRIEWSYSGGFGNTIIIITKENKLHIEDEYMGEGFIEQVFKLFLGACYKEEEVKE